MSHGELEERIKYALHKLGVRNAHYDFEHLCRHVARLRVCSNILPATGPVAAGGDQGRDFETFRTYLATHLTKTSTFAGAASGKAVAFACTVQENNLPAKIRKDALSIAAGPPVDSIHYFAVADIPVAKRHALQAECLSQHGLHLELYDGTAITSFLAQPDLFWIATEYLSIPANVYPRAPMADPWYEQLKDALGRSPLRALTYAAFQDVKRGLRSLITEPARQTDVSFWLEEMHHFEAAGDERLRDMARYEATVCSFRIKRSMVGQDERIRSFLCDSINSRDPSRLMDATCLLQYAMIAHMQSSTSMPLDELQQFRTALRKIADDLVRDADSSDKRCEALDLLGYVLTTIDPASRALPLDDLFSAWKDIPSLAASAPLFPLSHFANRLAGLASLLVDHPTYESLAERTDEAVAARTGRLAAAKNRVARAKELSKSGRLVQTLRELNRAKLDWFAAETIHLALGCLMLASRHYLALGLVHAAKYYSMATAYMASSTEEASTKHLIPHALFMAAECDYRTGAWLQALSFLHHADTARSYYSKTRDNTDENEQRLSLYTSYIHAVAQDRPETLRRHVDALVDDLMNTEQLRAVANQRVLTFLNAVTSPAEPFFFRAPFSECLSIQEFEWTALGVRWRVTWSTSPDNNLVAEEFLAISQIAVCDLANRDLYLIPSQVKVNIAASVDNLNVKLDRIPDNDASAWELSMPLGDPTRERHAQVIASVVHILDELSLRPSPIPTIDALKECLFQNTLVGNHYPTVYRAIGPPPTLPAPISDDARFAAMQRRSQPHALLAWNAALADEYDPSDLTRILERRYAVGRRSTKLTLPRLLRDDEIRGDLSSLRAEGWLDWQILLAVAAIAAMWRLRNHDEPMHDLATVRAQTDIYLNSEERPEWPAPPRTEFTREHLLLQLESNIVSTIENYDLVCRQRTPNTKALLEFARAKLRYFADDIPHDAIFVATPMIQPSLTEEA